MVEMLWEDLAADTVNGRDRVTLAMDKNPAVENSSTGLPKVELRRAPNGDGGFVVLIKFRGGV